MWRTAIIFHVFIAPIVMGALVLVALLTPALEPDMGKWLLIAAVVGFVAAAPISFMAARAAPGALGRV